MGMQMMIRRREQTRRRNIPLIGLSLVLLCSSFVPLGAQNKTIPEGSRIFITPMDRNLDGFITAEIQKQKIPVEVVPKQEDAQFVLAGFSQITANDWIENVANVIFGGKDKYEAECKLVSADGKTLIWAAEAGDRSLLFGAFKRGGQRKLAERLATRMNKDLFKSSAAVVRQEKPEPPAGLVTRSSSQLPAASLAGSWVTSRSSKTASSFPPTAVTLAISERDARLKAPSPAVTKSQRPPVSIRMFLSPFGVPADRRSLLSLAPTVAGAQSS